MKILIIIFLVLHFKKIYSGHIFSWPSDLQYQNAKYCQNITLYFSLESGLSETGYFYLKFPFSLGDFSTVLDFPMAYIGELSTYDKYQSKKYVKAEGTIDKSYFFNFNLIIKSNTWYMIQIIASTKSLKNQKPGYIAPIELYTVSSMNENRIYYDSNSVFDNIQLADEPLITTDNTNCIISNINRYEPEADYPIFIDIKFKEYNNLGSDILIKMSSDNFIFYKGCLLLECIIGITNPICDKNITLESNTVTLCNILSSQLSINYKFQIPADKIIRVQGYIRNGAFLTSSSENNDLTLLQFSKKSNLILSTTQIKCNLAVKPITMKTVNLQLFWGLEPTTLINNEGCPIILYKLKSSNKIVVWNNIKLSFSINKNTAPIVSLTIKIDLTIYLNDFLTGSISTNLTSKTTNSFRCNLKNNQYLLCDGFNQLLANVIYSISFKITLKSTTPSSLSIGGIQLIQNQFELEYSNMLSPSEIPVLENNEYIDDVAATGFNGATYFSNINYNQIISYTDNNGLTYQYNSDDSNLGLVDILGTSSKSISSIIFPKPNELNRLILFLSATSTQVCLSTSGRCDTGTVTNGDHTMLKIVFNNNVVGLSSDYFDRGIEIIDTTFTQGCSSYNTVSQGTKINKIYKKDPSSSFYTAYYHLTLICQSPISTKYCHKIIGSSSSLISAIAFRKTNIKNYPSFYSDGLVFEFILCFKYQKYDQSGTAYTASILEKDWTLSSSGVIPSYVITKGTKKYNIKISWLNYYAKTGNPIDSDSYIPIIFRFGGIFYPDELIKDLNTNVISFLFNNGVDLSAYKEAGLDSLGNDEIGCFSRASGQLKCRTFPQLGDTSSQIDFWPNHQRIDIDYSLKTETNFDLFIPLKPKIISSTIKSLSSFNIILGYKNNDFISPLLVFRVIGSVYKTTYLYSIISSPSESYSKFDISSGFWNKVSLSDFCKDSSSPQIDTLYPLKSNIYYESDFKFTTQVQDSPKSNCINNKEGSLKNNWGVAFTVSSYYDLFSNSTFSWDFDGESKGNIVNKCVYFNYKVNSINKRVYAIICTVDEYGGLSGSSIGGPSQYLQINNFQWPWYWGVSKLDENVLRYAWSNSDGRLVMVKKDTSTIQSLSDKCSCTDLNIPILSKLRKFTVFITPNIALKLNSSIGFDGFIIKQVYSLNPSDLIYHRCEFNFKDYKFLCVCVKENEVVEFKISYFGTNEINIDSIYSLDLYLSYSDNTMGMPYYFYIYAPTGYGLYNKYNMLLEICSLGKFNNLFELKLPTLIIGDFDFINTKSVYSFLKFTFNTINTPIYKASQLMFNLGYLASPTQLIASSLFKCVIYEGNYKNPSFTNKLASKFETMQNFNLFNVTFLIKDDILDIFEFTIKCNGFYSPDYSEIYLKPIFIQILTVSNLLTIQTSNLISPDTKFFKNINEPFTLSIYHFYKNFSYLGSEANYFITFSPSNSNIDTNGRIILTFEEKIPRKLNRDGIFDCLMDNYTVFCEFNIDGILIIHPNKILNTSNLYTLQISGISEPYSINPSLIFMGVDNDTNLSNGIIEEIEIKNEYNYLQYTYNMIYLLDFNISKTEINNMFDMSVDIRLSKTINEFYFEFDKKLKLSIKQSDHIICKVFNESFINIPSNCSFTQNLIVKINLILNYTNELPQIYRVILSEILSPIYIPNPNFPLFFTIFYIEKEDNKIWRSLPGSINITMPRFYDNQFFAVLNWYKYDSDLQTYTILKENPALIYIGTYRTKLALGSSQKINISYIIQLINHKNNFLFFPINFSLEIGNSYNDLYIACKPETPPGIYTLKFNKLGDVNNYTSPIPPLIVEANSFPCQLKTNFNNYNIPINGRSLPVIIDFSKCIPVNFITITSTINLGFYEYGFAFYEKNEYKNTISLTLNFDGISNSKTKELKFLVYNRDIFQNLTFGLKGSISFKLSGENANSYKVPEPISLTISDSIIFYSPPIPSIPKLSIYLNSVKIILKCSQPSIIYFILGLEKINSNLNYQTIQILTEYKNISLTNREINDPYWKRYGFKLQDDFNPISVNITNLKSNGIYYFSYFCVNQAFIRSPIGPNLTWVQSDNGGRVGKLMIRFAGNLSEGQKNEILCTISKLTDIMQEQIISSENKICNYYNKRNLQNESLFSNNSEFLNNSLVNNSFYTFIVYVLPNYETTTDFTLNKLQNQIYYNQNNDNFSLLVLRNCPSGIQSFPKSISFDYKMYFAPQLYPPNLIFFNDHVLTNINLTLFLFLNQSGYISIALHDNNLKKPSFSQLKKGVDSDDNTFSNGWELIFKEKNERFQVFFRNLSVNTNYSLWFATWNDDPTNYSIRSEIYEKYYIPLEIGNFDLKINLEVFLVILIGLLFF